MNRLLALVILASCFFVGTAEASRGRRRTSVKVVSAGTAAFAGGAAPAGTILLISSSGQSNSIGSGGTTVLSTSDPGYQNDFWNNTALVDMVEGSIGLGAVESHHAGLANILSERISGQRTVQDSWGIGATGIVSLSSNPTFSNAMTEFSEMYTAVGGTRRCAATWIQGETDNENAMSGSTYIGHLVALQASLQTQMQAAGCTGDIPLFIIQMSQFTQDSAGTRSEDVIGAAQWEACRDNSLIVCAGPSYQWPMNADGLHRSNVGHRRAGAELAKAVYWWLAFGLKWQPLHPDTIACSGVTCTIDITGGGDLSNLQTDTTSVTRRYLGGLDFWDPSLNGATDDMPVITATSVSGRRITVTLNRNPSSTGRFRNAFYGQALALHSPTAQNANGSNFRDSYTWHARDEAVNLPNWLIGFDEQIDTCTGCTASATTTFRRDLALRTENNPDSGLICGQAPMFNGATRATWLFWVRIPTLAVAEIFSARNTTNHRNHDIRTGAADSSRIQIFLPTSSNDTGTHWLSATGALTVNTNRMIAIVYDGTGSGNSERLHVYSCAAGSCSDITAAGAFTGTIPAALTSSTLAEWAIGIGSAATANAPDAFFRHFMVWAGTTATYALSFNQVARLYNSGTPVTGAVNNPLPLTWLPLQGNLEDTGSTATPTKCRFVGTGNQWILQP